MIYRRVLSLSFGVLTAIALGTCLNGQTTDQSATHADGAASSAPISISITQPTYGFNVLPGSIRRIFATVMNGKTNAIAWSVTGGAKLSSNTGNWVDITAPETASKCAIQGEEKYTVASATQFVLTARSQESPSQASSITINVCKPAVQVHVVPFYTTVYAGQKADVQAFVWGAVNRNVSWAITAQPNKGDGTLTDTVNEDTAFSATAPGRYTLTATSVADGSKRETAIIYVTGHAMPYEVTPSKTMPVDCTVDPALSGKTYDVGPSQHYKTIQSVPWESLTAGSTVRIHNEDPAGTSPTTYHEYFQVMTHAKRDQPVRVCGVPDSHGNLPVVDADNATGRSTVSKYAAGYTVVGIGTTGWAGSYKENWTGSQYLILEGIKIQNAKPPYTFTSPAGATGTPWIGAAACIRQFAGMDTVVRGIDAYNCGNGFFADFNSGQGFAAIVDTLYEGNHLHSNGVTGSSSFHQFYVQGWNELIQFNIVDEYQVGAHGSNFKGRGFPEIIRYNHFGDGALRQLDLVDNEDAYHYTIFEGNLDGGARSFHALYPADEYTPDLLAAAVEAHHADYVYGNTFVNSTSMFVFHYSTDHGFMEDDRLGTLWFYNNSFYEQAIKYNGWYLFDTSGGGGGGNNFHEVEWPQIQVLNNVIWMDSPTKPYFYWNVLTTQFTTFGKNAINAGWGTGNTVGGAKTGWSANASPHAYQGASISAGAKGISNLMQVASAPFDLATFAPHPVLIGAGSPLPDDWPRLPVRFEYGPSAIVKVRKQPLTIGAME